MDNSNTHEEMMLVSIDSDGHPTIILIFSIYLNLSLSHPLIPTLFIVHFSVSLIPLE